MYSALLFNVIVRATIIAILLNLRAIIRWKNLFLESFHDWISFGRTITEVPVTDTQNERTPEQCNSAATTSFFRYYVGPARFCTQPLPPPASVIIAANFSYPPPPLPEYYIGPAIYDVMGPPPLPCCVAESRFTYPPPPLPPPRADSGRNDRSESWIRWTSIVPVSNSPVIR